MASVRKEIVTKARADSVWSAIRDVGALHTRLVPGFVTNTKLKAMSGLLRSATVVIREPIVTIDEQAKRLVWSAEGGITKHYNASLQVFSTDDDSTRVVWIADFLPDTASIRIAAAMDAGLTVMEKTLKSRAV
jgi:hypothetical protein